MGVYICPVCAGRGFVDAGFYFEVKDYYPANTTNPTTPCRSCNGKGIVFETVEYSPHNFTISDEEVCSNIGYCTYGDYLRSKGENNNGSDKNQ